MTESWSRDQAFAQDVAAFRNEISQQNALIRELQNQLASQGRQLQVLETELLATSMDQENRRRREGDAAELFELCPLPVLVLVLDEHQQITRANAQAEVFFKRPRAQLLRKSFRTLLSRDAFRRFGKGLETMRRQERALDHVLFLELADRTPFSVSLALMAQGQLQVVIQDLSIGTVAENSERLAHFALEQLREGVIITDPQGVILKVNHAFTEISGYTADEALGKTPALLHSGRHSPRFYQKMWEQIRHHGWWAGEVWNRRKGGEVYPEWLQINRIVEPVTHQTFYVATFSDITEKKEHQKSLDRLAHYDALTGLPNRRFFERSLENLLHRADDNEAQRQGILFIDLDKFKEVNDRHGHQEGDLVLKEAAQRITACVRDSDVVSRIGGDEFVLSLARLRDRADAETVAEKLVRVLQQPFLVNKNQHRLSASVGISLYPEHGRTVEDLMRRADSAMYKAKEAGKNCWSVFDPGDETSLLILDEKKRLIWQVIENPESLLDMHFQPLFSAERLDRVSELEALLRLKDQQEKGIRTDEFIALAEQSRLMPPLGEAIFQAVCHYARQARDAGLSRPIAVNLSAEQFYDPGLLRRLEAIAGDHELALDQFNFEITETATMQNIDLMRDTLHGLREAGCRILLDDFGTGYASLSQLRDLPVDILKLDRSFVDGICVNQTTESLIRAMLAMARALNLKVVAEGVEHRAQMEWLRTEKADWIQGYLLSRPRSVTQILQDLENESVSP